MYGSKVQNICAKQLHTDFLTYNSYNRSLNNFKWVFAVPKRGQTDRNKTTRVKAKKILIMMNLLICVRMSNGTNHNTSGTVSPSDYTEEGNQSCLASSNSLRRFSCWWVYREYTENNRASLSRPRERESNPLEKIYISWPLRSRVQHVYIVSLTVRWDYSVKSIQ